MSFYRTYRPQIISDIDNVQVREQLLSLLTKKITNLPHAYFFSGPKGAGKTTAARIIAKLFTCEKVGKQGPCGVCSACVSIGDGSHIDVLEIDAASNRGIDDVRELRDRIAVSPALGAYKVFIIDEVHMMTTEAFNALLKTLEEPPAHAVFILATTDPQKVPVTVRSRCMEISFNKARNDELMSALQRIATQEHLSIEKEALLAIADVADGAFRDAVKLLEQVSFSDGPISLQHVMQIIKKSDATKRELFLTSILTHKNAKKALMLLEELIHDGVDMKAFLTDCLRDLENDLLSKVKEKEIVRDTPWKRDDVVNLSKRFLQAFDELRFSTIPELPIELAFLEFIDEGIHKYSIEDHDIHEKSTSIIPSHHISNTPSAPATIPTRQEKNDESEHTIPPLQEKTITPEPVVIDKNTDTSDTSEHLNLEKLTTHWPDYIEALKPYNHSVAGVIRGARPKSVEGGVVIIEAFYKFHQERLSEAKVRDILSSVLKQLFGVKVRVDIVLGKK